MQHFRIVILNSRLAKPFRTHWRHQSRLEQPLRAHWRHRAGSNSLFERLFEPFDRTGTPNLRKPRKPHKPHKPRIPNSGPRSDLDGTHNWALRNILDAAYDATDAAGCTGSVTGGPRGTNTPAAVT